MLQNSINYYTNIEIYNINTNISMSIYNGVRSIFGRMGPNKGTNKKVINLIRIHTMK